MDLSRGWNREGERSLATVERAGSNLVLEISWTNRARDTESSSRWLGLVLLDKVVLATKLWPPGPVPLGWRREKPQASKPDRDVLDPPAGGEHRGGGGGLNRLWLR